MTHRPARRLRTSAQLGTLAGLALALGCSSISPKRSERPSTDTTPLGEMARAMAPKPASTKRPAAYTARVGPYAFHTDFPLDVSDPLYRELEDLPEQIEHELQLTRKSTMPSCGERIRSYRCAVPTFSRSRYAVTPTGRTCRCTPGSARA